MKTRIFIVMLALGCLIVIKGYAAQKDPKEKVDASQSAGESAADKADKVVSLKTELEKVSYVIGTQIAQNFKRQEIKVNVESLMLGMKDAMAGKKLALSQDEIQKVMTSFQQQMMAKQAAKKSEQAVKNLAEAKTYLEANKAKEGVKVLPSGLQYKVIKEGAGKTPTATDKVKVNYRGTFINGKEFDSSYKNNKPAEFAANRVIKGWTEALLLMKEGSKWELYIPPNLAYGVKGRPSIPPNSALIFEVELLEVVK